MVSVSLAYQHPMKIFQPFGPVAEQRQGYGLPAQGYAIAPASDYSASASYGTPPQSAGYGAPPASAYATPVAYPMPSYPTAYEYPEEEGNIRI